MNQELRQVIKNAKQSTLKVDGYGKLILQDENGHYSFTRNYEGYKLYEGEKIIGEIIPHWENGILKATYKNI